MGGTSLQFLLTLVLLFLCMKPTTANYLGLADTHLGCKEHERQALLKIKQDLIDDDRHLSSWSSDQDCCTWSRVTCSNQTGHVIMLNLQGVGSGKLNPSLIELKYLTDLDVSYNDFHQSQIPEFIASFSNVTSLDLSGANFGRNIPFQLGNLSNLQYLNLGGNNFNKPENIEWLSLLSSLEILYMDDINLSKVNNWLHVVNKLPYLTYVHLDSCNLPNIFSVPLVNSSTSLDVLDLSSNNLTSSSSVLEWLFNSNTSVVELYLFENQFQGLIPIAFSKINTLAELGLDSNEFEGEIPKAFGGMCNLKTLSLPLNHLSGQLGFIHNSTHCANHSLEFLDLGQNQIMGSLPDLTTFPSLTFLDLSQNRLNGTIPESLGKLSNLESLYLQGNSLEGVISDAHFSKLTKLKHLYLSNNLLNFNFSSDWVPPFQLNEINLRFCQLGPRFPKWLQTQKNYYWLDISNSAISDSLSNFNLVFPPQLGYMNLSYNQISGQIPNLSLEFTFPPIVDLSSNKLEGRIPQFLFESGYLDLSKNLLSGPISSLCEVQNGKLNILDLSNNQLSRPIPDSCLMHFEGLLILNLANNHFHGKIPSSVGFLHEIVTLDLGNNNFSGKLPSSLKNCTKLVFFNLKQNDLSGQIPMWLGISHPNLVVLILRSNHFYGAIPTHICHLAHLQILDLALNQISGSMPKCLNNLTALTQKVSPNATISHSHETQVSDNTLFDMSYDDRMFFMWKGKEHEYKNILGLLKSIDLSSNNLTGRIPREIVELVGLVSLNLSRNRLTGQITSEIDMLQSLDALDLSQNQLSGGIPSSLSHIDRLSVLDLSNNNFSGKIPTSPHLDTFKATSYEGNPNLCGVPLPKKCSGEEIAQNPAMNRSREHAGRQDEKEGLISIGFYVSVALGFIAGFWGVVGTLVLNMSLRVAFFRFLNNFKDRLYVAISVNLARVQRQLQN
ncbi:receptor-like protein EIX2 [Quercus lobata]|uniref:Leucine-rich repeat-containing N-terminal plant-type domain-containing protein n=1 Tax=Quercus lobata TaxID=97700 RepID=A0A7N2LVN5_QUELO|nr:receptor-like protein EIX2 [Quercus lobata]